MLIFVFRPSGHGPKTFTVLAGSQDEAFRAVNEYIAIQEKNPKRSDDPALGWPEDFTVETYGIGQVVENDND